MKKACLLLTFVMLFSITINAQDNSGPHKVNWGDTYKEPVNSFISNIAGITPEGFYVVREKQQTMLSGTPSKAYIEFYNKLMNLSKTKEIDLKYKGKKRSLEDILYIKGELYLLTTFNNVAQQKNYLFVQNIRPDKLTVDSKLTKIAEVASINEFSKGVYDFHISRDSTKILVYGNPANQRSTPESFEFQVFDQQFQPLWNRKVKLPYRDQNFEVAEYQVDNEGNVYLLGILYDDGQQRTRRNGKPSYRYIVLASRKDSEQITEYKVSLGDKFITDLTFRIDNAGQLICCGFYSEKGTFSIKGTYYFRIDPVTQEMTLQNTKPFDFEFVTEYFSNSQRERAKNASEEGNARREPELFEYSLDNLILRSDGGALLVAEQYYIEQYTEYNYDGTYRINYLYNYNDIIVVNIRPDGEIEWATRIPKRQETVNDNGYFSSYAMATVQDKLYFIFNDNPKNFDDRKRQQIREFNGMNSVVALSEVQRDGSVSTAPLFQNRDAGTLTRPKFCKQSGRREMIIYGERNRSFRFANLFFD
jgi:hypothetical protein